MKLSLGDIQLHVVVKIQTVLSAFSMFSANTWSYEYPVHDSLINVLEESRSIHCSVIIQPKILEGTYLETSSQTDAADLKQAAASLEWNFVPPAKIYEGLCSITYEPDFSDGNSIILHAHSNLEDIVNGMPHYFFYLSRNIDTEPDYKYMINWNGSLKWSHAQWSITEKAELTLREQSHCLIDPKISICLD